MPAEQAAKIVVVGHLSHANALRFGSAWATAAWPIAFHLIAPAKVLEVVAPLDRRGTRHRPRILGLRHANQQCRVVFGQDGRDLRDIAEARFPLQRSLDELQTQGSVHPIICSAERRGRRSRSRVFYGSCVSSLWLLGSRLPTNRYGIRAAQYRLLPQESYHTDHCRADRRQQHARPASATSAQYNCRGRNKLCRFQRGTSPRIGTDPCKECRHLRAVGRTPAPASRKRGELNRHRWPTRRPHSRTRSRCADHEE